MPQPKSHREDAKIAKIQKDLALFAPLWFNNICAVVIVPAQAYHKVKRKMTKFLFQVHFFAPDVKAMEIFYVEKLGFTILARYGYLDNQHNKFPPQVGWDELAAKQVRLRLIELERGAVNLVLMPSQFPTAMFDHLGVVLTPDALEAAVAFAADKRLAVERSPIRTFITTPYHFRIELQPNSPGSRYAYSEAAYRQAHLAYLTLGVREPDSAAALLGGMLGLQQQRCDGGWALRDGGVDLRIQPAESRLMNLGIAWSPQEFAEIAQRLASSQPIQNGLVFDDPFGVRVTLLHS